MQAGTCEHAFGGDRRRAGAPAPSTCEWGQQSPNGTQTTYAYDARHRVTDIAAVQTATSTLVATFAYTLDSEGERTQVVEADGTIRQYGYDSVSRLTSETVTGALSYAKVFAYDPVGNRLTQTTTGAGAGSATYAYDSRDRLTTENSTAYTYDANGNLTAKAGEATYGWDFENRLTSVPLTVGTNVTHEYDPDGNRVQTVVTPSGGSAVVDNVLVDPGGCASCGGGLSQAVLESDGGGNITVSYVRVGGQLLAEMRPGSTPGTWTTRFVHGDGLGSVRALTDETGTTIDTRGYEAFGTKNVEAGSDPLAYGFAGEPFQQDSMLAYHRARWMDARVGRFDGMDRFDGVQLEPLSLHRYLYAGASPTGNTDPTGLASPTELLFGQQVHAQISFDFAETLGGCAVIDANLKSVLDVPSLPRSVHDAIRTMFGASLFSRPDLVDRCGRFVYEIKPESQAAEGAFQLTTYLTLMNQLDPQDSQWTPGGPYVPPLTVEPAPGVVAYVDLPSNGLILYRVNPNYADVLALALIATTRIAALDEAQTVAQINEAVGFAIEGVP